MPFVNSSSPPSSTEKWDPLPLTDTHRRGGPCPWLPVLQAPRSDPLRLLAVNELPTDCTGLPPAGLRSAFSELPTALHGWPVAANTGRHHCAQHRATPPSPGRPPRPTDSGPPSDGPPPSTGSAHGGQTNCPTVPNRPLVGVNRPTHRHQRTGHGRPRTRAVLKGGGGRRKWFITPTETNVHADALCFMAEAWARHKTTEPALNNGWRLVAVGGGWWLVAVGGGWRWEWATVGDWRLGVGCSEGLS